MCSFYNQVISAGKTFNTLLTLFLLRLCCPVDYHKLLQLLPEFHLHPCGLHLPTPLGKHRTLSSYCSRQDIPTALPFADTDI